MQLSPNWATATIEKNFLLCIEQCTSPVQIRSIFSKSTLDWRLTEWRSRYERVQQDWSQQNSGSEAEVCGSPSSGKCICHESNDDNAALTLRTRTMGENKLRMINRDYSGFLIHCWETSSWLQLRPPFSVQPNREAISEMASIPVINDFGWLSGVKAHLYASGRAGGQGDDVYPSFLLACRVHAILKGLKEKMMMFGKSMFRENWTDFVLRYIHPSIYPSINHQTWHMRQTSTNVSVFASFSGQNCKFPHMAIKIFLGGRHF